MLQATPGAPPIIDDQLCVVYQADTGAIVHIHRVTTYQGGQHPSEEAIRSRAIAHLHAFQQERVSSSLKTVLLPPEQIKLGVYYKIDVETVQPVVTDRK
ncbi:hypothetical protein [Spirosoma flavum]|uniref:Uncharacterized protein n=1 Tax=Spirosoma flavum TaxID=2048557 RepID=A0ABW6AUG0_9BACT